MRHLPENVQSLAFIGASPTKVFAGAKVHKVLLKQQKNGKNVK
jgi:hypothetical protein